jgi:hypothetical protein
VEKDKYTIGLGIRSHTLDIYGDKYYYLDNILHREDGPAIEHTNGYKAWYLNGDQILCKTQKEFDQLMRLKAFW